jgi:prepilin-type N-terminal cleavage/methylation domain-containing protein
MRKTKFCGLRIRAAGGFTLIEVMIATSLALVVAAAAFTFLSTTMRLHAENLSLNNSHLTARTPLERMIRQINSAGCSPILVDEKGANLAGSGPAPGIRFCILASPTAYSIPTATAASATSISLKVNAGQATPRATDILLIHASPGGEPGNGIQVPITAVSGSGPTYTLTLQSLIGAAVAANSSAFILQQGAFIAVGGQLRYYNRFMSEARDGATLFNTSGSFDALAQVEAAPPALPNSQATPFSYTPFESRQVLDSHVLRVNLRVRSANYSNRVTSFDSFLNMQSSIAVKSSYVDPARL